MTHTALLLVDIQNDYFDGGAMELKNMEQAADNAATLLQRFRDDGLPVIHVQHFSVRPGSTFFVPDTEGVEINQRVAPRDNEKLVTKHYPNSFRETDLGAHLEESGIDSLLICGAMTHMCIDATTRAAFDAGYGCTVAADACATRDLVFRDDEISAAQVHSAFLSALSMPYAQIIDAADYHPPGGA